MVLVVFLTVRRAQLASFRDYEAAAARIMAAHGGAIARAVVLDADPAEPDHLTEVHLVDFPDAAALAAYRADPALAALAEQRARAVARTQVWQGEPGPRYG